jgi:hypothetical protein
MIALAFVLLCAAALLGLVLAVGHIRGRSAPRHPSAAVLHGALGAASLAFVFAALDRGLPRRGMGTAGFAPLSAALLLAALLLGLSFVWRTWRGRSLAGGLIGAHAGLAIAALVVLLALLALG